MIEQDLEFIYQSLMPRTKIQLSHLGDLLGCRLKSSLRKSEMATGLTDYIINRSDEWLRCLPQRELDLLEKMVKMEKVGMGEEERNVIGTLVWLNAQESGTKGPLGAIHLFDGLLKGFDQVQEMMGKMPPAGFGMGVPRVGRNDPCPCGSGLKYKNCHGKYNS